MNNIPLLLLLDLLVLLTVYGVGVSQGRAWRR